MVARARESVVTPQVQHSPLSQQPQHIGFGGAALRKPAVVTSFNRPEPAAAPFGQSRYLETPTYQRNTRPHADADYNEELLDIPAFLRAQAD
jgi:hypothetical protein